MKSETLKERIAKAEERVEKKRNTIEKKNASIEKKLAKLSKETGKEFTRESEATDWREIPEAYWTLCDVGTLTEDIEHLKKEITETETMIEKYKAQLAGELETESTYANEIPETMKQLETELIERWNAWDKDRRTSLANLLNTIGYKAFIKGTEENHHYDKHTAADYDLAHKTDAEIEKANTAAARSLVLDLYNRVKEITGEVHDWNHITTDFSNTGSVLNGWVRGNRGTASVESILAGGWNIQRLHIRVLVKSL